MQMSFPKRIGDFGVSLNYPILNFRKMGFPKNVWMWHWKDTLMHVTSTGMKVPNMLVAFIINKPCYGCISWMGWDNIFSYLGVFPHCRVEGPVFFLLFFFFVFRFPFRKATLKVTLLLHECIFVSQTLDIFCESSK